MLAGIEQLTPYQSEDPSPTIPTHRMKEEKVENIENIYSHSLSVQYNRIQCYLSTECIQNQFLFLKDCTSKHVGPIVSYKGFSCILTLKTVLKTNIDGILSYCW